MRGNQIHGTDTQGDHTFVTKVPVLRNWENGLDLTNQPGLQNNAFRLTHIQATEGNAGFTITGQLRAFEAVGAIQVTTLDGRSVPFGSQAQNGVVIIHASEGAPAWGNFETHIQYPHAMHQKTLLLKFYVSNPKDGSEQDVLRVQVQLP